MPGPSSINLQTSQILELEIVDYDGSAQGVARHENLVIFVPKALPGDIVECEVTEIQKRFAKARLLRVVKSSIHRSSPKCSHFSDCGGCQLQSTSLEYYPQARQTVLSNQLRGPLQEVEIEFAPTPRHWNFRNRARFRVDPKAGTLGYLAENRDVLRIIECPILEEPLQHLLFQLNQILPDFAFRTVIKEISIHLTTDQSLVLGFLLNETISSDFSTQEIAEKLSDLIPDLSGIYHFIGINEIQWLESYSESTGSKHEFSPLAFSQTNQNVANQILEEIKKLVVKADIQSAVDFYCGSGNILFKLAPHLRKGLGLEISQESVEQGRQVCQQEGWDHLQLERANLPRLHKGIDLSKYNDLWIFNPPRKGLGKRFLDEFFQTTTRKGQKKRKIFSGKVNPKNLIYVSCNPKSMESDLKTLTKQGYQVNFCKVFDMFPWTSHFELLVFLQKL